MNLPDVTKNVRQPFEAGEVLAALPFAVITNGRGECTIWESSLVRQCGTCRWMKEAESIDDGDTYSIN
jgi:hypothetical protein